ncbi:hypothetical protein HY490_03485, partial [Candidatus Woesearchaeota archaeon]|nr:hypothetical protein [Candidatus Woesearchaeota archaeon]
NTANLVRSELEKDLYLLELLKEDIINASSLARKFFPKIKEQNPKATVESISIAIKRYAEQSKKERISKKIRENIAQSTLSSKNDVIQATYKRNHEVMKLISDISPKIKWDEAEIFLINQGPGEITVILDKRNQFLLDPIKAYKIEYTPNLTAISVKENIAQGHEGSISIPGVYAHMMTQLARKSINVIAVNSTLSQITFMIKSKDFVPTYQTLQDAINFFRE